MRRVKRYNEFQKINEAPLNMDAYEGVEKHLKFTDAHKRIFKSIGFDTINDYYATMVEGNFLIRVIPSGEVTRQRRDNNRFGTYLSGIDIIIYQTDHNGKLEVFNRKIFELVKSRNPDEIGVIHAKDVRDIMKYIINTIPNLGMSDLDPNL